MERGCSRHILSKALWHDGLPKGGKKEVKTEELTCRGLEVTVDCWRVPRLKAELVFLVPGERVAVLVVLVGCLYAFELGKLLNRLMPLRSVITSLLRAQGAGCPRHHGLPKGTSGQRESSPKCQEAGDCLPESRPFTSRKVWCHEPRDLQLDTSAGWAALPLAVRMPTCSSPPCAPDMKR